MSSMPIQKISPADQRVIIRMFKAGSTGPELAWAYEVSRQRIHQILRKHKVNTRKGGRFA